MCKTDGRNQPTDRIGSKQNSTATIVPTTGGLFHTRYPTESSILNKANVSFFFQSSAPRSVQTGPGAHPASCTMITVSYPGVKRPERGVDQPPPSTAEVKETVELYLYSTSGLSYLFYFREFTLLYDCVIVK